MISLFSYLAISLVLFVIGIMVMLARKNVVAILLGIELVLNAAALNFVAYSRYVTSNLDGHIFALFIILVAAAEAAIGLSLLVIFFRTKFIISVDTISILKG